MSTGYPPRKNRKSEYDRVKQGSAAKIGMLLVARKDWIETEKPTMDRIIAIIKAELNTNPPPEAVKRLMKACEIKWRNPRSDMGPSNRFVTGRLTCKALNARIDIQAATIKKLYDLLGKIIPRDLLTADEGIRQELEALLPPEDDTQGS